ncbi:MAG: hypothetical protein WD492_14530 [Alkalispirochaeta sp.]
MTERYSRRGAPMRSIVVLLIAVSVVAPAVPVFAQWRLTPVWADVTPGRVTVEPWGVGSGENATVAVVTEDRRIRVRDPQGSVVATARTGVRTAVGVLHEGANHSLLIPARPRGASGSHDVPLVRIDLSGSTLQVVGQPATVETVIPGDARFVMVDGESLIYSVSATGMVTHAAAAGGILWQRRVPATPTAALAYRGAVYVALEDGRVFRFDGNGTGIELFRMSAPVVAMEGIGTSSSALLALDQDGVLSLVDVSGDGIDAAGIRWRTPVDASGSTGESAAGTPHLAVTPPRGQSEWWYAVVARRQGGVTVVTSDGVRREEPNLRDVAIDDVLTGRVPSGGYLVVAESNLLLVSSSGTILDEVELRRNPAGATWIDAVCRLIVTYRDWTIEAWEVAPALEESRPPEREWSSPEPARRRAVNVFAPGALTARAEAVLAGTSRSERNALLSEMRGQRRRAVLSDRVGEARSILRRLVREALETPDMRGGHVRNDFPGIRRAAVEELGYYMDRTSREVLAGVVRHDPDHQVVATALRAFARYGVDEVGVTQYAVARFRRADDRGREVLAPAMIELLELTSAVQRHPAVADEALDLLIESNMSREIRRRAVTIARERSR